MKVLHADALLKYDQDHLFLKLSEGVFKLYEPIKVVVSPDNQAYIQRRDVILSIWQKFSAEVIEAKLDLDLLRSIVGKEKFLFVSDDKMFINKVADSGFNARFVLPYNLSNSFFLESLKRRGHSGYLVKVLNRREGAIARVLKMPFDEFYKVKESVGTFGEEQVLSLFEDGQMKEERELFREMVSRGIVVDVVSAKFILARLVLEKKLYAKQEEGVVYYRLSADNYG